MHGYSSSSLFTGLQSPSDPCLAGGPIDRFDSPLDPRLPTDPVETLLYESAYVKGASTGWWPIDEVVFPRLRRLPAVEAVVGDPEVTPRRWSVLAVNLRS